jgi:hypothetical protein
LLNCSLQADVKAQQEKLSQLTMVLDKAGSHTPLAALAQEHAALKERNTQQQARADEIVSARLAAEQKTRQVCGCHSLHDCWHTALWEYLHHLGKACNGTWAHHSTC